MASAWGDEMDVSWELGREDDLRSLSRSLHLFVLQPGSELGYHGKFFVTFGRTGRTGEFLLERLLFGWLRTGASLRLLLGFQILWRMMTLRLLPLAVTSRLLEVTRQRLSRGVIRNLISGCRSWSWGACADCSKLGTVKCCLLLHPFCQSSWQRVFVVHVSGRRERYYSLF